MYRLRDKIYGTIIGGALGDILSSAQIQQTEIAIKSPADLASLSIQPGCWTENTATLLALLSALYSDTNPLDEYREILHHEKHTCTLVYLDIDTFYAIQGTPYIHIHNPCSLMRTAAVSLYCFDSYEALLQSSYDNSILTHNCVSCADVCKLFSSMIDSALHGRSKKEILSPEFYSNLQLPVELWGILTDLTTPQCDTALELDATQETLYLVLYYFKKSNNYKEGLTMILGTAMRYKNYVGTAYGQLAGAYYGLTDIDESWLDDLDGTYFTDLAERCFSKAITSMEN